MNIGGVIIYTMANFFTNIIRRLLERRQLRRDNKLVCESKIILGGDKFRFLDIGASGGILPRFFPYRGDISFTGCEPDKRSLQELISSPSSKEFAEYNIVPSAVWSHSGKIEITFTRKPMCSSVYQPNTPFLAKFTDASRFDVIGKTEIACSTLDTLFAETAYSPDFIKLDLEGGEHAVLQGAARTLQSCLGLHVEVSFQQIRKNQPLFGDVSGVLRTSGFEFMDFVTLCRWSRDKYDGIGQLTFADALFLRSPEDVWDKLTAGSLAFSKARSYLWLLLIYHRYDLALVFLDLVSQRPDILSTAITESARELIVSRRRRFDRTSQWLRRFSLLHSIRSRSNADIYYIY